MKKLIFIIFIVFTSCLGTKKISEKSTDKTSIEKTAVKNDSVSNTTVNKGIKDEGAFKVAESKTGDIDFDKRVNDAVSNILSSINFQKSSGDNSYRFYYDEQLRELRYKLELAETRNSEVATNKDAVSEKEKTETIEESFKKTISIIPWWIWAVALVLFWPNIIKIISPILNFIKIRVLNPK